MASDSRVELPSAATTSGAWKVTGVFSSPSFAFTPVMWPVRSSTIGAPTLQRSYSRAPAFCAWRASCSSKSSRLRTRP